GRSTDDLTRDGGVLESENDRLLHRAVGEEGLPGEEQPQTDADDENGDDRRPAGGILVFEWQHGSLSLRQTGMLRRHSRVRQANHSEVHLTKFAYFCGHEQYQPEELVRHAVLAEEAGFDMVVVSEHFHPWVDDQSAAGFAFATIAAMAQATERIEFTTGVTTPLFRFHPGIVAQAAATLDRLSNGRFRLGVGTGENINEGPLGYEFPAYKERNARMTEALEIMRRLLDGEKLTYDGEYYRTDRAKLYSPPIQEHLPIYLPAAGPKAATLAREKGDRAITS